MNMLGWMPQRLNIFIILDLALLHSSCLSPIVLEQDLSVEDCLVFVACDCIRNIVR